MWNQSHHQNTATSTKPAAPPSTAPASEPSSLRTTLGPTSAVTEQATMIGKSLVIKGEISGSESIYIDGRVEGSINLPGHRVTVGKNGHVAASITAREIVVQGKIIGNVNASDLLEVHREGSLTGDAIAQRISVEDGAFFNGKIDIRRPGAEKIGPGSESRGTDIPLGDSSRQMGQLQVV